MSTSEAIGRNAPCPCGSGKKHKACCQKKVVAAEEAKRSPWKLAGMTVGGIALVVAVGLASQIGRSDPAEESAGTSPAKPIPLPFTTTTATTTTPTPAIGGLTPQPPGDPPPGKVWSPEHGHWHDIPGAASTNVAGPFAPTSTPSQVPPPGTLTPQPPGDPPPGKVWSPEHGHWHDLPAGGVTPQ